MSVDAARGTDTPFDARIHALRGQPGQIRVAAALRGLLAGSAIRDSHREGDTRVQDPYSLRCQPQVAGACLDLLDQAAADAGARGECRHRQPAGRRRTARSCRAAISTPSPVAFAADIIALALAELGGISERRIALLTDPVLSGLPAFLVREGGLNSAAS